MSTKTSMADFVRLVMGHAFTEHICAFTGETALLRTPVPGLAWACCVLVKHGVWAGTSQAATKPCRRAAIGRHQAQTGARAGRGCVCTATVFCAFELRAAAGGKSWRLCTWVAES